MKTQKHFGKRGPRRSWRRLGAIVALSLALSGLTAVGLNSTAVADTQPADPNDPSTPVTVSDDALPAPQVNGVVWTQAVVGNTVYAGGSFTNARPAGSAAGQNTVARGNIMAFNITTGVMTSFAPSFNAQVRSIAVSPDQTRIYVAGEFTTVNGTSRRRIAAFNASTGALITTFAPSVNYDVESVVATNTKVYAGGSFLGVGSQDRQYLAAFNASNGALLDWAPQAAGGTVNALTINPEGTKVVVGGSFTTLNGSGNPGYGLGMVDATTGASLPFATNSVIRNGTADGAILTLSTDGENIYGGGYTFGKSGGTWEGTFASKWEGGEIHWLNDCHGDTYGVKAIGSVVYSVGHSHYCENIDGPRQGAGGVGDYPYYRATATSKAATGTVTWEPDQGRYYSFLGQPAPSYLGWYPDINAGTYTGQSQGPWSLTGNSDYVVLGGEFTRVNGSNQQGLVRFAVSSKAPNDSGPKLFNTTYPLNVSSTQAGTARINWMANNDDDNEYLTYRVYRDTQNAAGLKQTITKRARRWETLTMGFTDTGMTPGSTHQYRVVVTDPFGNVANSPWTNVTLAGAGTDSDYVKAVYDSQPTHYWRMGEAAGTALSADRVGFMPATAAAGVTRGATGAVSNDSDKASTFSGANTGWAATATQHAAPDVFTLETWFKTTTTTGGRLIGWSARNTQGNSQKHDRQIYMDNSGRIHFGTKPTNQRLVVTSPSSYNNGQWHQAVGTLSKTGLKLYIDGVQVASRADVTTGEHLNLGYWRIGGDTVSGWTSAPSSGFFKGDLDEVAVYKHELSPVEVAGHYAAGTGAPTPNLDPVAAFDSTKAGLTVDVDGSDSSDPDGTVASYSWDFGDSTPPVTTPTATHTYAAPGTYGVTLTVTDDDGATDTITKTVTVSTPPVADFTSSATGVTLDVDGSTSTDSDGTIASYAWTFGDGGTATGVNATHNYAAGGTYNVKLTVTDNAGETHSVTKPVTIVAPNVAPTAAFTSSPNGLTVNLNAGTSSDPDGTVTGYQWNFGDSTTSTAGPLATHTYAAPGTYNVTLTVTDNDGATGTVTNPVTVTVEPTPFGRDLFERSVTGNWGNADIGGAWTRSSGTTANYNVTGGRGTIRMASAGSGPGITLGSVSSASTEVRATIGLDKPATGGGTYVTVKPRVVGTSSYYVDTRFIAGGTVSVTLGRTVGGTDTGLQTSTIGGLSVATGDRLNVKVQASGTSPTVLRAKVWKVGTAEPAAWSASVNDTTAGLQAAGSLAFWTYLSGSATNAPVIASFDDLWAGPPA